METFITVKNRVKSYFNFLVVTTRFDFDNAIEIIRRISINSIFKRKIFGTLKRRLDTGMLFATSLPIRVASYQCIIEPIDNFIVRHKMLSIAVFKLNNKLSLEVELFISRVGCVSIMR